MWHPDKTDTRLFCGFLRKAWLRIATAIEERHNEAAERHDP